MKYYIGYIILLYLSQNVSAKPVWLLGSFYLKLTFAEEGTLAILWFPKGGRPAGNQPKALMQKTAAIGLREWV